MIHLQADCTVGDFEMDFVVSNLVFSVLSIRRKAISNNSFNASTVAAAGFSVLIAQN